MYFPENMNFQYFFFDTYIGYFLQVLPIAIIVGIIYWFIKYKNNKDIKISKQIWSCLFISYITGLICLVLGINIISNIWYSLLYHQPSGNNIYFFDFSSFNLIPDFYKYINSEVIGNLLMFIPFGILYPLSHKTNLKRTILIGFISVFTIELLQPIFARSFDINDIILNTLGIVISSVAYFLIKYLVTLKKKS